MNGQKQTAQTVYCPEGEAQSVSLLLRQVYDFTDVSVRVCAEDGMAQDNAVQLSRQAVCPARVLLVGENPYFWQKALEAFPRVELTTAEDWRGATLEGYDVYVSYATDGLDMEEAYALYQEACNSILYRSLAQMAQEGKE